MKTIELNPDEYQPAPPEKKDYGIGIIGCGGIMRSTHLPAYRNFGYRVVAACDIDEASLNEAQERFDIPFATTDVDELLARDDVDLVDLAVHASQRRPLIEKIAAAGKPVLSQKPFALSYADAVHMVETCREAGVPLMINQQARWAPAHRALRIIIERGVLGHVYSVLHVNRAFQDVPGSWYVALENFNIVDHGIHFIDLSRYFTGRTPVSVKATTTTVPGQVAVSPMIYTINLEYEPDAEVMSTLHFNNIIQTRAMHGYDWYVDGTEGSAAVSHGELVISFKEEPRHRQVFRIEGRWFPDAFGGSMGEMMAALTEGREPQTSGEDNLNSIAIAMAAVASSEEGRAVRLEEITPEDY